MMISQHIAQHTVTQQKPETRSLLELEGLGKEIWEGVDVQEYIDALRDEWETLRLKNQFDV